MVSGTAGSVPCPASKAGHERDDGGHCERLRRGLLRYGMIYARQEGRLMLPLAMPYLRLSATITQKPLVQEV